MNTNHELQLNNKTTIDYLEELSNFIFTSKYARYREDLQRRETWEESVDRVLNMHLAKYAYLNKTQLNKIRKAFDLVKQKKIVPSMRSMQFGGDAIFAHQARIFNCSAGHITSIRSFAEFFYLLLCGTGVTGGFSKKAISLLPKLVDTTNKTGTVITYVVEDTIEGWADSVEALLLCYFKNTAYSGRKIVFDYSRIRAKGTPLKTGGGKAPGHKGLKQAHSKIKALLDYIIETNGQNELKPINAYDILMHCADAVLSGGIRRAATMAIFDLDDEEMMRAKVNFKVTKFGGFDKNEDGKWEGFVYVDGKDGGFKGTKYDVVLTEYEYDTMVKANKEISWIHIEPQRARSNNSALLLRSKVTIENFTKIIENTKLWGEPGFILADDPWALYNPCAEIGFVPVTKDGRFGFHFCVSGDTNLITRTGITSIYNALGKEIEVWNGEKWSKAIPIKTQSNVDVYRVHFNDGSYLDCSSNHKFLVKKFRDKSFYEKTTVEIASDILTKNYKRNAYHLPPTAISIATEGKEVEQAYEYGYFKGDGHIAGKHLNKAYPSAYIYGEKDKQLGLRYKIVASGMKNVYGTESIEVRFTGLESNLCQLLKGTIPEEIFSWNRKSILNFIAGWADADGSNASKGIRIYGDEKSIRSGQLLLTKIGIKSSVNLMAEKGEVTNLGERKNDVWYLQITKTNEIPSRRLDCTNTIGNKFKGKDQIIKKIELLQNKQDVYCLEEKELHQCVFNNVLTKQCNLTSQNGALITTLEDFLECTEAATLIGTLQAGYTYFPYLNQASQELTESEALLGVSITGLMDNPDILLNPRNQYLAAQLAVKINKEWAEILGIRQAARITCVKPEGTSSLLLKAASGIHPHHARKYFRRVQCNKQDNVYKHFKKSNPKACEESVWSANKTDDIATFPVEVPARAILKEDLSAIKHLDIIKSTQQNWVQPGTTSANERNVAHNVSCTVMVKSTEWEEVISYLFDNRNFFSAVSLLPASGDKDYKQAPLEKVLDDDNTRWLELLEDWKTVDYTTLVEKDDKTNLQQVLACAGGACDVDFSKDG